MIAATFETLIFYRGMAAKYPTDRPFIKECRTDRQPKDSSRKFHEAADSWFVKRFGIPYRSQVVCVTSRKLTARAYAATPEHLMRVVPLTEYRYCWSPKVSDLLFKAKEFADVDPLVIHEFLDTACYQETDLEAASRFGHEVMLHCASYVAVPVRLFEPEDFVGPSGIILPPGL